MLKRFGVETTYYDPLIGAGHREAVQAEHARGVHRGAGLAVVRDAGHPGDRRGRACARRDRADGQHLGDAAVLSAACASGVDIAIQAGTKYLSGHSDLLLGMVSANERCWKDLRATFDTIGALRRAGRHVPRRCAACAPCGVRLSTTAVGARGRALARGAAGSRARAASRARDRSGPRDLEARLLRRLRAVQHRAQADAGCGRRMPSSTR